MRRAGQKNAVISIRTSGGMRDARARERREKGRHVCSRVCDGMCVYMWVGLARRERILRLRVLFVAV